jgi:hypothetical protein
MSVDFFFVFLNCELAGWSLLGYRQRALTGPPSLVGWGDWNNVQYNFLLEFLPSGVLCKAV